MSLYWPESKVAIDIVDDPARRPFDRAAHPDVTVIEVTCEQLMDPDAFDRVAQELIAHMDVEPPPVNDPEYRKRRRMLHQTLFGTLP